MYNVGVAHRADGMVEAWAFGLPGCRAIANTSDELMALIPVAIGEYLAWQDRHNVLPGDAYPIEYKVIEEVNTGDDLFEIEKTSLSEVGVAVAIRCLTHAYEDLMSVVGPLTDAVQDWKPPAGTVKIDAIYPDVRTIREMAAHVATALSFHLRAIGNVVERVPGPAIATDLQGAYEATAARLQALTAQECSGEVYKLVSPRNTTEWTARKSVRRLINHQRFHTREIEQRLGWLVLGVPDVLPVAHE